MAKIACIGHTTLDIILLLSEGHLQKGVLESTELCLSFPSKLSVDEREISLGGNAPNAATGLCKLGHNVILITQVGEDEIGEMVMNGLERNEFDLSYVTRKGESDCSVILSFQGDRTILSHHCCPIYPFPKNLPEDLDWIYLSSLGFADFEQFHQDLQNWLQEHPKTQLAYNPGRNEIKTGLSSIEGLLKKVHTLILNKEEAKTLWQVESEITLGSLFQTIFKTPVARVAITNGKEGAYFAEQNDVYYHVPAMKVEPVDATGAGDAFSGGYVAGIALGRDARDALVMGAVQSGHVVTVAGATNGLLTLPELDEILASPKCPVLEERKINDE